METYLEYKAIKRQWRFEKALFVTASPSLGANHRI